MSALHVDDERPGGITLPCPHGCPGAPEVHKFSCPWHGERGARLPAVKLPDGSVHVLSDGQSPTTPVGIPRDDERGFPHPASLVVSLPSPEGEWCPLGAPIPPLALHHFQTVACAGCGYGFPEDELHRVFLVGACCDSCIAEMARAVDA